MASLFRTFQRPFNLPLIALKVRYSDSNVHLKEENYEWLGLTGSKLTWWHFHRRALSRELETILNSVSVQQCTAHHYEIHIAKHSLQLPCIASFFHAFNAQKIWFGQCSESLKAPPIFRPMREQTTFDQWEEEIIFQSFDPVWDLLFSRDHSRSPCTSLNCIVVKYQATPITNNYGVSWGGPS